MTDTTRCLQAEIDAELEQLSNGADRMDADEAERPPYRTRLRSLHEAVAADLEPSRLSVRPTNEACTTS